MSTSRQIISGGLRQERTPGQKSNFVQTCNLLSQYIKEKGSLRDLNLEIGGKVESLEALVKPGVSQPAIIEEPKDMEKSNHPSKVLDSAVDTPQDSSQKTTSKDSSPDSNKAAQLTIFYSGRILVFDDFPADKARELVAVAKSGSISSNTWQDNLIPSPGTREGLPPRPQAANGSVKPAGISSNAGKEKMGAANCVAVAAAKSTVDAYARSDGANSDLPIARRSSINRFLEKRKDRAAAKGPYQVREQPAFSSKGDDNLALKL